jgi:hypothetical protein
MPPERSVEHVREHVIAIRRDEHGHVRSATVQVGTDMWGAAIRRHGRFSWIDVDRIPRDRLSAEESLAIAKALTALAQQPEVVW